MTRQDAIKWLKAVSLAGIYGGLLMPAVLIPVVIFPFVFSKLIVFQILIELTLPAYLILAWIEPKYRPRWTPLYVALAAYFVAILLSVIFAVDPLRAWWGNQERMNGLFTVLHFFAWLTMATSLLTTWKQWKNLLVYQVALSGVMAVVALLQKVYPNLLRFPAGPRVGGLLDNPIYMAGYQIFSFFFVALLWMKQSGRGLKIFLAIVLLLDIGAFIAAQSRGALVGLAVGIAVFAAAYALMSTNKKAKIGVVSLAVLFFAGYGLLYSLRNQPLVANSALSRLTNLQVTAETRFIAWKIAWQGFLERPLTGWGYDNFHVLFNTHYNPESLRYGYYETWFDRAHNTLLDVLSMTGLIGFLTYSAIWVALLVSVVRAYRKGWIDLPIASVLIGLPAAYFTQNLLVFDQPAGFMMSFLMFAFISRATAAEFVGAKEEGAEESKDPVAMRSMPWIGLAVLEVLALGLVWRMSVLPFRASYLSIKSNNFFLRGSYALALDYAKQAAAVPTPYLDEQTFLQSRNLISLAEQGGVQKFPQWKEWHDLVVKITEEHLKDHGENAHPHFIYARFLQSFAPLASEDLAKAESEYREAIKRSPKRQQLYFSLGRFYLEVDKKEQAYDMFRQAADFDTEVGEAHWFAGLSRAYDLGQWKEGAEEMALAFKVKAPYVLKNVREADALAVAYAVTTNTQGFLDLMTQMKGLPGATPELYLDIARIAERLSLIPQRDLILAAIANYDPTFALHIAPLKNGSATSIEAALRQTQSMGNVFGSPSSPNAPAPVPSPVPTSTSPVATSSSGPRR